jgi:hypothetical protein
MNFSFLFKLFAEVFLIFEIIQQIFTFEENVFSKVFFSTKVNSQTLIFSLSETLIISLAAFCLIFFDT